MSVGRYSDAEQYKHASPSRVLLLPYTSIRVFLTFHNTLDFIKYECDAYILGNHCWGSLLSSQL